MGGRGMRGTYNNFLANYEIVIRLYGAHTNIVTRRKTRSQLCAVQQGRTHASRKATLALRHVRPRTMSKNRRTDTGLGLLYEIM